MTKVQILGYNGKTYEYHSLGNVRSFTTRGKKLWPTDAETAAGSFALHWDGSGQELPNIPRKGVSDLNYYFRVLPANACGQVADSSTAGTAGIILPDTTPPSQPATLSVSPASWSNAETRTVTWAGVTDMPSGSSSLGAGHIQYVLNPEGTDQAAWEWQNTDSNTANGSFELSAIGLEDGIHALYVRGIDANGNYGLAKGVEIPVDRTPPSAPAVVTILPDDWTKENEAVLTWTSVSDTNDLLRVEYAVDTGAFTDTGLKDQSYTGFVFDISSLADGEHTVAVRGVDIAGNTGAAQTVPLRIDRSAPTLTASALDPVSWTDADSVNLTWEGAGDAYSGLAGMSYQVDDGTAVPLTAAENGQQTIDISNLADGIHTVALTLADALDNVKTVHHTLFVDRTAPETELTAPQNGDVVTGVLEVWGTVKDRSLSDWTVTAKGSSGKTVTVVSDMEEKDAQQLGVLDTGMFADGETIEVVLTAHDLSGHESTVKGVFLKADHSARPVPSDVTITAPSQGEVIAAAHKEAAYTIGYAGAEAENRVISDGQPAGRAAEMKYNLYPILCPENSVHSLSVLSKAADGTMHYSQGMASMLVISDLFAEAGRIEAQNGVALSAKGAEAVEETGTITSKTFTVSRPMLAIRLHTVCQPAGRVSCEYSTDHGASWHPLEEGKDAWFDAPQTQVAVRAALSGAGTILQGLDITGVYEINPVRWKAQLLRPVTAFDTTGGEFTQAKPEIKNNAQADLTVRRQYMDGVLQSASFTASFLPYADGSVHQIAQIGLDARGTLHGSGAETVLLLRNTPNAGGICETGLLSLKGDTYALRLETLCVDGSSQPVTTGKYAYSFDGNVWTTMELNQYVLLPRATNQISVRAELPDGVTLRAMHLEGVVLKSTAVSATLIKAPYNVQAADYGDYYENEKLRLMQINSRLKFLQDTEKSMDGYQGSVKSVLREKERGTLRGIHGTVFSLISVEEKYRTAIETALGNAIQDIVTDNENDAKRAINHLKETGGGRATFMPISAVRGRVLDEKGLDNCFGFVALAHELVRCDSIYCEIIKSLLGRIAVSEDIDCAITLAKKYSYKFKIVTLDGQVINAGGAMTGGSKINSAGFLARKTEAERLAREAEKTEKRIKELADALKVSLDELCRDNAADQPTD